MTSGYRQNKGWYERTSKLLGLELQHRTGASGARYSVCRREGFFSRFAGVAVAFGGGWDAYRFNGDSVQLPAGAAHYLEHVLFKKNGVNYGDLIAERGGTANAGTSFSSTVYYFYSVDDFESNLDSLLEIVLYGSIPDSVVEEERGIILAEFYQYTELPHLRNMLELRRSLFGDSNYSHDLTGNAQSIKAITPAQLRSIHAALYSPPNLHFVAAGEIDPDGFYSRIEEKLKGRGAVKGVKLRSLSQDVRTELVTLQDNVSRPLAAIGWRFSLPEDVSGIEKRRFCLSLALGFDLLFGESSDFYQRTIDGGIADDTLSYGVDTDVDIGYGFVAAQTDVPERFFNEVKKEIGSASAIISASETELDAARKKVKGSAIAAANTVISVSKLLLNPVHSEFPPLIANEGLIMEVTTGNLIDALEEALSQFSHSTVITYPKGV